MRARMSADRRPQLFRPCLILLAIAFWILAEPCLADSKQGAAERPASALRVRDLSGKTWTGADVAAHKATVFLFIACQCPISNAYAPRMTRLAGRYGPRGVLFLGVYSNRQEGRAEIAGNAREHSLAFPVIRDADAALAELIGAKMTPEAIVADASGAIRYRGRIDDNVLTTQVRSSDLRAALDAVLDGKAVARSETRVVGCAIRRLVAIASPPGAPTYSHDVARILHERCESCHRVGEIAPFSLQGYSQASAWAADIKRYTRNGAMPPWKPAPGYGEFRNARVLSEREKATLARWADAGAPQGNPKETPPAPNFVQGWQLGKPDMILTPTREYHLAADGEDVYRNFVVDPHFTEDRWVSAVECRIGNRAVVHHILDYIDASEASERLAAQCHDGQPGYTSFGGPGFAPVGILGAWAPGYIPELLPPGVAIHVPAGAKIVIQVHYHKDGKPEADLTRIGLHFAQATVQKQVRYPMLINFGFRIPPGADHYKVTTNLTLPRDCHALGVAPHMHLLGREMKLWATLPNGTERPLVWIKDWDFNWQSIYAFNEPVALPEGTTVHLVAYYDNSPGNLRNPNREHPRTVGWGEQTTDEMCLAFLVLTRDDEHLAVSPVPGPLQAARVAASP